MKRLLLTIVAALIALPLYAQGGSVNVRATDPSTGAVVNVGDAGTNALRTSIQSMPSVTIGSVPANQSFNLNQLAGSALATPFDVDSGAGTQSVIGISLRKAASGGSVEYGTSSDPLRIDPTGATTQPISAASLPLPTGAAQEHATAGSPASTRLSDGAAFYDATKTGQLPSALVSGRLDVNVGNTPTVTANAGTNLNTSALALDATVTGRLPAGASPANGESNTNANLSRIGGYNFIYNGSTWDRWTGAVTANIGTTNGLALDASVNGLLLSQGSTTSGQKGPLLQAAVTTANPSYTTAQSSPLSLDPNGGLRVSIISGAGSGGTALADRASFTYGATSFTPIGGVYNSSITALTSGQAGVAALDSFRTVHVGLYDLLGNGITPSTDAVDNTAVPGSGPQLFGYASAATPSAVGADGRAKSLWLDTVGRVHMVCDSGTCGGTTLGQSNKANSLPVTMAYDQGPIAVNNWQLGGWPIAAGVGPSTPGTQRIALSRDSGVTILNPLLKVGGTVASGDTDAGYPEKIGGVFNTTQPTVTTGQRVDLQASARGELLIAKGVSGLSIDNTGFNVNNTPTVVQGNAGSNAQAWWTRIGDATNGPVAVKAASTAAGATDPALVVAISPNNTVAVTQSTSPWVANISQFGGSNVVTGTGTGGAGIPRMTVSSDSSLTANIGTTNGLALDATLTGRLPAGGSPADNESNTNTSLSRIGSFAYVYDTGGGNWDRWTGAVSQTGGPWTMNLTQVGSSAFALGSTFAASALPVTIAKDDPVFAQLMARNGLSGFAIRGSFNRAITSTGDALNVYSTNATDPCATPYKGNASISQTTNTQIVTGQPGRRVFVCSLSVVGGDAENISVVEGTGATCGTGTAAVVGGTTAANGPNFAANGGMTNGSGIAAIAITNVPGNNLCVLQSGSGRVAGNITYAFAQ